MGTQYLEHKDYSIKSFTYVEIVYYLYFALMLFAKGIGLTQGQRPYTLALILSSVLILVKFAITRHSAGERILICLLIGLGVAIYISSGEIGAMILIVTVLGMKDVPLDRIMNLGCVVWIVSYVLKMLLVLVGVQSDFFRVQEKLGLGHIIRWSLGQPHPNVLQVSYMIMCAFLLFVFGWEGKKLVCATLLLFVGNIYVFMYSVSYTGIVLVTLYLGLNLYLHYRKSISIFEKIVFALVPIVCMLFSILGPKYFKGELWKFCDKIFNNRFTISKTFMNWNPISLFGTGYCDRIGQPLNNLDCSYVYALMHYGIIFFVLFFGGYFGLVIYLIKKDRRKELAIITAMFVAAITEPFFVNTSFKNISVVFLGSTLYIGSSWLNNKLSESRLFSFRQTQIKPDRVRGIGYKEFKIDTIKHKNLWEKIDNTLKNHYKKIIISAVAIGVISAVAYAFVKDMPAAYYMNRSNVQIIDGAYITLDINDLPDDFDGKILNYTDAETPMQCFDGNIVTVEYVRGIISMGVWTVLFGTAVLTIIYMQADKRKNNIK